MELKGKEKKNDANDSKISIINNGCATKYLKHKQFILSIILRYV